MVPIALALQLAQFAPSIIKLITGSDKAADVAGQVIGIAKTVTGTETGQEALEVMQADPDKAMDFQLALASQQVELEKSFLLDIQDARAMQIAALTQEDKFSKRFVYFFSGAWSVFTMIYVTCITFWAPIEESGKSNASTVLGFLLGTAVSMIFSYFFGSTKGSAEKTRIIANPPQH